MGLPGWTSSTRRIALTARSMVRPYEPEPAVTRQMPALTVRLSVVTRRIAYGPEAGGGERAAVRHRQGVPVVRRELAVVGVAVAACGSAGANPSGGGGPTLTITSPSDGANVQLPINLTFTSSVPLGPPDSGASAQVTVVVSGSGSGGGTPGSSPTSDPGYVY